MPRRADDATAVSTEDGIVLPPAVIHHRRLPAATDIPDGTLAGTSLSGNLPEKVPTTGGVTLSCENRRRHPTPRTRYPI